MNQEEIQEIKARAEKAGPAPWMRNGKTAAGWRIDNADPNRVGIAFILTPTAIVPTDADAEFIAEARQDVPRLVEEVERLNGLDAAHADALHEAERQIKDLGRLVDQAREIAERDGLEYRELRRVVNAAKEWRAADSAGAQDATLEALDKIENAVDALSPTAAQGLAMEKARARVVEAARGIADTTAGLVRLTTGPTDQFIAADHLRMKAHDEADAAIAALKALEAAAHG